MRYLLDTNVLSEWARPKPDQGVVAWLAAADEDTLYLSVIALAEIRLGIEQLPPGRRRSGLTAWLDQDLTDRFHGRIVAIDRRVAETWAVLVADRRRRGATLPILDTFVAATALVHGMAVVSRNVRHLEPLGVAVIDPWAP